MALPQAFEARGFYRSAYQRFEDAEILLNQDRTTGAVYLAGYSVECMLKALILSSVSALERVEVLATFRGRIAHDFEWLRNRYVSLTGAMIPADVARDLTFVNTWTTDLRYMAGSLRKDEAETFLITANRIIQWADGRL